MSYFEKRNLVPGRVALVIISIVFLAIYTWTYFAIPVAENRRTYLGHTSLSVLWGGVLVVAVWFQQNWARYLLAGFLFLAAVLMIPSFMGLWHLGAPIPPVLIVTGLAYLGALATVIWLPGMRELTHKRH